MPSDKRRAASIGTVLGRGGNGATTGAERSCTRRASERGYSLSSKGDRIMSQVIRMYTPTVKQYVAMASVVLLMLVSSFAMAFTAPAVGDFGYDIYDIVVNQILNGPIGFIGGIALIVFGATKIMQNWMMTILCIIAGTVLIRADDLVVTLGAVI
jgi:hypothetical protein